MTIRVYLMPRTGTGTTLQDPKRAKYSTLFASLSTIHYGPEPYCIVVADVDTATHNAVMANADVRALPADLDTTIAAGAQTTIVSALEAAKIPAQWVTVGMSYRVLLRRLAGMFRLLQTVHGRGFRFLQAALDDPLSSLPANVRQGMQDSAQSLQLDTTGITGTTTLRAALTSFGNQFQSTPLQAMGATL